VSASSKEEWRVPVLEDVGALGIEGAARTLGWVGLVAASRQSREIRLSSGSSRRVKEVKASIRCGGLRSARDGGAA
jgi:hypothetical protein